MNTKESIKKEMKLNLELLLKSTTVAEVDIISNRLKELALQFQFTDSRIKDGIVIMFLKDGSLLELITTRLKAKIESKPCIYDDYNMMLDYFSILQSFQLED